MKIITSEHCVAAATYADFEYDLCKELSHFVVVEYNGKQLQNAQIVMQFEFLAQASWVTIEKEIPYGQYLRTRYCNIFKDYHKGDFARSNIDMLQHSGALRFLAKERGFLHYRITKPIYKILDDYF